MRIWLLSVLPRCSNQHTRHSTPDSAGSLHCMAPPYLHPALTHRQTRTRPTVAPELATGRDSGIAPAIRRICNIRHCVHSPPPSAPSVTHIDVRERNMAACEREGPPRARTRAPTKRGSSICRACAHEPAQCARMQHRSTPTPTPESIATLASVPSCQVGPPRMGSAPAIPLASAPPPPNPIGRGEHIGASQEPRSVAVLNTSARESRGGVAPHTARRGCDCIPAAAPHPAMPSARCVSGTASPPRSKSD